MSKNPFHLSAAEDLLTVSLLASTDSPAITIKVSKAARFWFSAGGMALISQEERYPNVGSEPIARRVIESLTANGIKAKPVSRGLDHGVFACFKVAFNPETNPLNIPIVQVSLFSSENPSQHLALGRAVSSLRSENIAIIVSGMAVHNLSDWRATRGNPRLTSYGDSFDKALKEAAESKPEARTERMLKLLDRSDARQAHPTFEHLLPVFIGAGAAGEDSGKQLWTLVEGSMSWAQYRFGEVAGG